jgi:hypothetical protein
MKDFKKMVKMAAGGSVEDFMNKAREFSKSGKDIDPGILRKIPKDYVDTDPGIGRPIRDTIKIPGVGEVPKQPMKTTPSGAVLLKKGGKVKRGNKKK